MAREEGHAGRHPVLLQDRVREKAARKSKGSSKRSYSEPISTSEIGDEFDDPVSLVEPPIRRIDAVAEAGREQDDARLFRGH